MQIRRWGHGGWQGNERGEGVEEVQTPVTGEVSYGEEKYSIGDIVNNTGIMAHG